MQTLPDIALSVRQPWAWAIVAGLKDIENREKAALTGPGFKTRPLTIHAAKGMTRQDYEDAQAFMASIGVYCPRPDDLVRGAIIGAATVTAVVEDSDSPWFFGPRGLVLADARRITPIPAAGALGFFTWRPAGEIDTPRAWMRDWQIGRAA